MYTVCYQVPGDAAVHAHQHPTIPAAWRQFERRERQHGAQVLLWIHNAKGEVLVGNDLYARLRGVGDASC